jgi:hypothetical protein
VAENVPEAWVDKRVTVLFGAQEEHRHIGVLQAVNDRGLVLQYQANRTLFFPWTSVVRLELGEPPKGTFRSY